MVEAELARAIVEVRSSLGSLSVDMKATHQIMAMLTLIDRVDCKITHAEGESAYEISEDGNSISFRYSILAKLIAEMRLLADEVGMDSDAKERIPQIAVNLFVIHELLHIRQNFPNFATVAKIKDGAPGFGLPLLDLAADVLAASIAAHVECQYWGEDQAEHHLAAYVTCLTISYVVGTFVYDSTTKAEKRQRSLGLVISMVLSKAKLDGRLKEDRLFDRWEPSKPVIALNIEKTKWFNAIVIDELPGLLLPDEIKTNEALAQRAWQHIGKRPIFDIILLVSRILTEAGIIVGKEVAE